MWFSILMVIAIIAILILIGFLSSVSNFKSYDNRLSVIEDFTGKFIDYANNALSTKANQNKNSTYIELLNQSYKVQNLMGTVGIIEYYDPITGLLQRNYPIVINFIPLLQKPRYHTEEIMILQNCLHMRMGQYKDIMDEIQKEAKNPLILMRKGVQTVVIFPLTLLQWSGLLNYQTKYKISNSLFVKFVSFIILIIGLVSSIITIVSGKETIIDIVKYFN